MSNGMQPQSYFALGDSLTAGTGTEAEYGFVHIYHQLVVQSVGKRIELNKFGTVGAKTNEILLQLRKEDEMRQAAAQACLITVTTGGNDLLQAAVPFFLEGRYDHLTAALRSFVAGSRQLLNTIQALKKDNDKPYSVLMIGLYNPFPQVPIAGTWVTKFNKYTQMLSRSGAVYVDVYKTFAGHEHEYLSDDLVHPNANGHRAIAQETFRALPTSRLRELFA